MSARDAWATEVVRKWRDGNNRYTRVSPRDVQRLLDLVKTFRPPISEEQRAARREKMRLFRAANPGSGTAADRRWTLKNREKKREMVRQWRKRNPEKVKAMKRAAMYRKRYGEEMIKTLELTYQLKRRLKECQK